MNTNKNNQINKFPMLSALLHNQNKKHIFPAIFAILFIFLPCSTNTSFSDTTENVLIINSDMSIKNYSLAHTGFKSVIPNPKGEIDLGNKWKDEAELEKMIQKSNPAIIYCIGIKAYLFSHKLAKDTTLIFSSIINWRRLTMEENTYGISSELLPSMQLMMYRYLFPKTSKIGVLYSKEYNEEWMQLARDDAKDIGISLVGMPINKKTNIRSALKKLLKNVDAVWLTSDPLVLSKTDSVRNIFQQCDTANIPVFTYSEAFIDAGATLVISADIPTIGKQAARLTLDLLSRQKKKERVNIPAGSHISINLKKVEKNNLLLNTEALDSVNQIIQ
ncbi:MAG: hypothetical protein E3K37_06725 [Candidatus Kuenenia sp.]|nr:hypothetical protein [Candidatus Kuenenia hertensis]